MQVTVMFNFEAPDKPAAQRRISSWKLPDDVPVLVTYSESEQFGSSHEPPTPTARE
jgi:hypothetical protein